MSSSPSDPADDLQFQTVEPVNPLIPAGGGRSCVVCKRPIDSMYFAVRDKTLCPDCARMVQAGPPRVSAVKLVMALMSAVGAGIVGSIIWFGVRKLTGFQVGYIAILVGYLVGKAVRKGSGGRGGPVYQAVAVGITYACISLNFVPDILDAMQRRIGPGWHADAVDYAYAFGVALKLPFYEAGSNPILLLIVAIGLWQAWKSTRYYPIPMTGPYQLARITPAPPPGSGPPPLPASPAGESESEVIV